jgi:ribosome biogenesis GTPase A
MAISWYPGHMRKANKELAKLVKASDLIVELLDARTPNASRNPLLASVGKNLPRIIILNKSDLADPDTTAKWHSYFDAQIESEDRAICFSNNMHAPISAGKIASTARKLLAKKTKPHDSVQLIIVGIPNVGKSTFINTLSGRKIAKTGNEPAITKGQQRIKLDDNLYLVDTPGLLWPKLEDQVAAYKLATLGTIRNTAIDMEDIAWFAAEYMLTNQRAVLEERYSFDSAVQSAEQLLNFIGTTTGAKGKGGRVILHKVAETLLNDLRSGKLGAFSMESPPEPTLSNQPPTPHS